jgi:iron complex outermembrane receptor protein
VRGTDTDADQPLLQIPADRLGLTAAYRLPHLGAVRGAEVELGATLVREQDRFPTQVNAEGEVVPVDYRPPPDGYALFRVGVEGALALAGTPVRFSLTVENLLDTAYRDYLSRYRYFAHDTGRNVVLRLQIPLGGS